MWQPRFFTMRLRLLVLKAVVVTKLQQWKQQILALVHRS